MISQYIARRWMLAEACTEIHFHFSFSVVVLTLLSKPLSVTCKPIIIEHNRKETVGWYVWYLKFINMCAMRKLIHFQFRTPQMTDLEINHYVLFSNINLWSLKKDYYKTDGILSVAKLQLLFVHFIQHSKWKRLSDVCIIGKYFCGRAKNAANILGICTCQTIKFQVHCFYKQ